MILSSFSCTFCTLCCSYEIVNHTGGRFSYECSFLRFHESFWLKLFFASLCILIWSSARNINSTTANQRTFPVTARPISAVHEVQLQEAGPVRLTEISHRPISCWQLNGNVKRSLSLTNHRQGTGVSRIQDPTWPSSAVPRRSDRRAGGE